jgi:hypothetical protein
MSTVRGAARGLGGSFDALDKYPTGPQNATLWGLGRMDFRQ